jgi:hypothetical protein
MRLLGKWRRFENSIRRRAVTLSPRRVPNPTGEKVPNQVNLTKGHN